MARYAVYDDGAFIGVVTRDLAEKPVLDGKPYRRFYLYSETRPAQGPGQVTEGPVVNVDHVLETHAVVYTVRDKTAGEINAEKAEAAQNEATRLIAKVVKRVMATQFAIINDVRARHGQGAITVAQYLAFFDSSADGFTDQQFIDKMRELV